MAYEHFDFVENILQIKRLVTEKVRKRLFYYLLTYFLFVLFFHLFNFKIFYFTIKDEIIVR